MECVRIVLKQTSANYRKPECVTNKMTYPLPPVSTIIGAVHNACGYTEYHNMDISVQGNFESMHREPYTDYCFFNNYNDERNFVVKLINRNLHSTGFYKVATRKDKDKKVKTSFIENINTNIINQELYDEFVELKKAKNEIKEFKNSRFKPLMDRIKKHKKYLSDRKKKFNKKSEKYKSIAAREKYYKDCEKLFNEKMKACKENKYENPVSYYKTLTTSLKYYEILDNINLIIHIRSDNKVLNDIVKNIDNLTAIGRSEDFVDIVSCDIVELTQDKTKFEMRKMRCELSAYVNAEDVSDDIMKTYINPRRMTGEHSVTGTVYYMPKDYIVKNNKRVFNKKRVLYISDFGIRNLSENIWIDLNEDKGKNYIVNFI